MHIDFHYGEREPDGVVQGVRRFEIDRPQWLAVASPARAAMLGELASPADLLRAPLVMRKAIATGAPGSPRTVYR